MGSILTIPLLRCPPMTTSRTSRLTEAQRCWIGENRHRTINSIANYFKKQYSRSVSREVIRRWTSEGAKKSSKYSDKPRAGRPKTTTSPIRKEAKRLAKRGFTVRSINKKLKAAKGVTHSISTTRRILKAGRKPLTWAVVKQRRRLSDKNKILRLTFCQGHLNSHTTNWIFIDAKFLYLYVYPEGKLSWAWQDMEDMSPSKLAAKPGQPWIFLFYGAVGWDYKSPLYFVPPSPPENTKAKRTKGYFNSGHFITMLQHMYADIQAAHPRARFKMLWDHARQHTSKRTTAAVANIGHHILEGYPAQCWDINIIENCWGMLDQHLIRSKAGCTATWYKLIRDAWGKVQQESINKLVNGVRDRLHNIVEHEGNWVPHH